LFKARDHVELGPEAYYIAIRSRERERKEYSREKRKPTLFTHLDAPSVAFPRV
jgi:hypothetical protein